MRTEAQVVVMAPIEVPFGVTTYPIKPLTVLPQGEWRAKLDTVMQPILTAWSGELSAASFAEAYSVAMRQSPTVIRDLIFEYASDLDKDKVLAEATDEQIAYAFMAILEVAFPFAKPLEMVTRLTASQSR